MSIIEQIKQDVIKYIDEYKVNSDDHYDFWNEHIKYVYEQSRNLAQKYSADIEIVTLGALLHDIALIRCVGSRKDHNINGAKLAEEMLSKYNYDIEKMKKVIGCVYNHRSSKNATNIEELCVADADILAHFDNIPMLFDSAFNLNKIELSNVRQWMDETFEKDYNDLSENTKMDFEDKYKMIRKIILNK